MSRTPDMERVANLLEDAREVSNWNYRLQVKLGEFSPDRDRWSAVLGHVENAIQRLSSR